MLCPFCSHDHSKVLDSRDAGDGTRRRRECLRCGLRFSTYEGVQTRALLVVKQDGRREEFNRDKLWASLTKACAKRTLTVGTLEKVVGEIEAQVTNLGRAEIPTKMIGEMVMDRLKNLDRVAYIRFASVYRDFQDIESFKQEVDALLEPPDPPEVPSNQLSFLDEVEPAVPPTPRRGRGPRSRKPHQHPA
jgi:transcriptional repressor NrdR